MWVLGILKINTGGNGQKSDMFSSIEGESWHAVDKCKLKPILIMKIKQKTDSQGNLYVRPTYCSRVYYSYFDG